MQNRSPYNGEFARPRPEPEDPEPKEVAYRDGSLTLSGETLQRLKRAAKRSRVPLSMLANVYFAEASVLVGALTQSGQEDMIRAIKLLTKTAKRLGRASAMAGR